MNTGYQSGFVGDNLFHIIIISWGYGKDIISQLKHVKDFTPQTEWQVLQSVRLKKKQFSCTQTLDPWVRKQD